MLEKSTNDKEFTGVPLQTRLLTEAVDQSDLSEHNLSDRLDLLDLYKRFIDRKYDIYQEEKMKITVSRVAAEEQQKGDSKHLTEGHQCLALQVLFPKEVVGIFKDIIRSVFKPQRLARYGIVH